MVRRNDPRRSANRQERAMVGESAETILKLFFKVFFFKKDFKGRILRFIFGEKLNSVEKSFLG